jgi:serine-type D-Ala-D-Ala carboxypeptidase (penicillin-binding protein 5/6)
MATPADGTSMTMATRFLYFLFPALFAVGLALQHSAAATHAKGRGKAAAPSAVAPSTIGIDTEAQHAIVVEVETGAVLLDKGADERIPPASMSKMMTAYEVFGMLKDGRAKLSDELPVSEEAWRLGGSKMFVPIGGEVSIDDLMHGMIVESGNDACLVLAQGLAGSESAFVDLMNKKAKEIGLKDSHFNNVTGLPDPDHWTTARDLATLAIRTIQDFPEYYKLYSEESFTYNKIKQGNRNTLLHRNIGADGLKTGHTEESGYSLTASVRRADRRIVIVLSDLPTMKARTEESERLVDWAFRQFQDYRFFGAGDTVEDAEVWLGSAPRVPLTVGKDLVLTLPRNARKDLKVTAEYDAPIPAPIKKGETLGKLVVSLPQLPPIEAPLIAAADVGRMGPVGRVATLAGYLVWGDRH